MFFLIKVGDKYLDSIDVDSGYLGHSTLNTNAPTRLNLSDEPVAFSTYSIRDKVASVIDLMRYGDIKQEEIKIIPYC